MESDRLSQHFSTCELCGNLIKEQDSWVFKIAVHEGVAIVVPVHAGELNG